jgi:hypothetical protein
MSGLSHDRKVVVIVAQQHALSSETKCNTPADLISAG